MPFDFLRKKGKDEPKPGKGPKQPERTPAGTPVPFDGLTEEWRLVGKMYLETRLSDALNKRESLAISDVRWAPIDGSSAFSPVPGLKSVDPYDLIVVIAGEAGKSTMSPADKAAAMGQKQPYDVTLEAPPLRIVGRVYLPTGMAPERLMDRSAEMFVPVLKGVAYQGERAVIEEGADAILVNRFYLRGVTVGGRGGGEDDEPLSQPARTAGSRPAEAPAPAPPPARPQPPRSQPAPPWASRTRPNAGPAEAPAPPQQPTPGPKPRVVPDWPAADRKPEAQPKKTADIEWPAADRKPESPPARPRPGAEDPPAAQADAPAPELVERPPGRIAEASAEASSVANEFAQPRGSASRSPSAEASPAAPAATEPPAAKAPAAATEAPAAKAPATAEGPAQTSAPAEPSPPALRSRATPTAPPPSRRDAGAKGWPAPESGCRPKRGGLGPRT